MERPLQGEQPCLGDLLTMVVNHFLAGIILQVVFSFLGSAFYSTCTSRTKNCSTHNRGSKSMFSGITYLDLRCLEKVKLLKFVLPNGRLMVIYHGAKSRTTLKKSKQKRTTCGNTLSRCAVVQLDPFSQVLR